MSFRVTEEDVKKIISTEASNLTPFITVANALVNEVLVNGGSGLSDTLLKEIERWLSAHFISIYETHGKQAGRTIASESVGGASISYANVSVNTPRNGSELTSTPFGLTAITLDLSGLLLDLGKRIARVDIIQAVDTEAGNVIAQI